MAALLLRMNQSEHKSQEDFTASLQPWFDSQVVCVSGWVAYRLAREAAQQVSGNIHCCSQHFADCIVLTRDTMS